MAGQALAQEKLAALADCVFYAPADFVWAVRRVLRALKPSLVIVVETEIWPNLFREVKRIGAGLALLNGRVSDRALPRYRAFRWFFRAVLPAADRILCQSAEMSQRFIELGAPAERVSAMGNLKYDFAASQAAEDSSVVALVRRSAAEKVWIAASTVAPEFAGDVDEDDAVVAAFQQLGVRNTGLALLLAPRKPERFDAVAQKLEAAGIRHLRRSRLSGEERLALPGVLLLDSIGELSGLFFLADVVFMGGSLAHRGGHNILEPAFFGKPVIVGPHMENFQTIADEFRSAGACIDIGSADELAGTVERVLESPAEAAEIGRRALACAEERRGATERAVRGVRQVYDEHLPEYRPAQPWYPLLWTLSRIWAWGSRRRHRRGLRYHRKLDVPVISIGNLTMGGTGKTPCVLRLTADLKQRGYTPGILTRGYGRQSPESEIIAEAGSSTPAERTGDEAQLFLRSGLAPVGIAADRFRAGAMLCRLFGTDVLLLDDGFQHLTLARNVDILLIDALNPFGGGAPFPLGRLREPLPGVARADVVVITRSEFSDAQRAIERKVRTWNAKAPVFQACLKPEAWVEYRTGQRYSATQPPFRNPAAFCGLGNPQSFRRTLGQLGIHLADWLEFEDHHRYRSHEVRRIAAQSAEGGADALVTTAKDAVNLPEDCGDLLGPVPLFWLEAGLAIDRQAEFLREVERRLD